MSTTPAPKGGGFLASSFMKNFRDLDQEIEFEGKKYDIVKLNGIDVSEYLCNKATELLMYDLQEGEN